MKNSPNSGNSPNRPSAPSFPDRFVETAERVRYSETDRMGIAHNAAYLDWFEIGRTEYCRQRGIPYAEVERRGFYLVVAEVACRYRKPLRYDDSFLIRTALGAVSPKKIVFHYELRSADASLLIAEGTTVHIAVDAQGTVRSLPEDILAKIGAP